MTAEIRTSDGELLSVRLKKVEKRRKDELKLDYKPNIDWWGSSIE